MKKFVFVLFLCLFGFAFADTKSDIENIVMQYFQSGNCICVISGDTKYYYPKESMGVTVGKDYIYVYRISGGKEVDEDLTEVNVSLDKFNNLVIEKK